MQHSHYFIFMVIAFIVSHSYAYPSNNSSDTSHQNLTQYITVSPSQTSVNFDVGDIVPWDALARIPIKKWGSRIGNFLYNKRYILLAASALGSYLYACRKCNRANAFLARSDIWSAWHQEMSLETLISIPQHELAQELVLEIQRRYSNRQNPTDFLEPLILFVKEIDIEIAMLHYLQRVHYVASRTHLAAILPINEKRFAAADTMCKRAMYLKNLFLSWAAEYKINHNKKQRFVPPFKSNNPTKKQTTVSYTEPPCSKLRYQECP